MIKIIDGTNELFVQDKEYVKGFYKKNNILSDTLYSFIDSLEFGLFEDVTYLNENGVSFGVSHFLGKSDNLGYDVVSTNEQLKTLVSGYIVFALADDDNPICLKQKDNTIVLLDVNSEEMLETFICYTIESFINKIK